MGTGGEDKMALRGQDVGKICNVVQYFVKKKHAEVDAATKGAETGEHCV